MQSSLKRVGECLLRIDYPAIYYIECIKLAMQDAASRKQYPTTKANYTWIASYWETITRKQWSVWKDLTNFVGLLVELNF